jgi:hypothetical protein
MHYTNAQNYTGAWEGQTDEGEFLQLNIIQIGQTLCGFSWDYDISNRASYCKANFKGYYNSAKKNCFVSGYSFMENSGTHALMNIKFTLIFQNGKPFLQGACQIKQTMFSDAGEPSYFVLKKVAKKPYTITKSMQDCMPPVTEPKIKPIAKEAQPKKPATTQKVITKPVAKKTATPATKPVVIKADVKKPIITPAIIKKDSLKPVLPIAKKPDTKSTTIPANTNGRENKEQSRIEINDKKIKISIYDNGTVDGDTVSVYFDNKLLVSKKRISTTPIELNLELDEYQTLHTLILYAENLGTIAPNTALVIVTTASGKRFQLYSSATLNQNAALVFEYKPK